MFSRSEFRCISLVTAAARPVNIPPSKATAYGKCIFADYTAVRKDMCAKEFMKLKNCYLVSFCYLNLLRISDQPGWI